MSESQFPKRTVYLGFGNVLEPHLKYRLRSHYMPLGKIGGKPAWLNPVNLPPADSLACRVCGKPMVFLIQVYATNPSDQDYSFHRTLFFFICRSSQCSRSNDASNIRAFRCTLPRYNNFYMSDHPPDPDFDGDIPDPLWKETYPHLCTICGCCATKKCGRCESRWYCSREHQVIDWNFTHKKECGNQNLSLGQSSPATPDVEKAISISISTISDDSNCWVKQKKSIAENPFVFPEYAVEMDIEYLSRKCQIDSEDDDEYDADVDSNGNNRAEKYMEDFKQYMRKHGGLCDLNNSELEGVEDFAVKDSAFKRFNKVVALNPEQVLRYDRGGKPLLATDHAPAPISHLIPPCSLCGSERQFELQLMPHLLALIGVDVVGSSIDWATLLLYTCARNCHISLDGYAEEHVHKQDFR